MLKYTVHLTSIPTKTLATVSFGTFNLLFSIKPSKQEKTWCNTARRDVVTWCYMQYLPVRIKE